MEKERAILGIVKKLDETLGDGRATMLNEGIPPEVKTDENR
jgi:hypothetical protein